MPALVDASSQTIVRRELLEIMRDFSTSFKPFHAESAPDLCPVALRSDIDEWNQKLSTMIALGIHQIGFAEDQAAYDEASDAFFNALKEIDNRLASRRYFHGDSLTESDIVLFTPLVRLEIFYAPVFGVNKYNLSDFPHLCGYLRELYALPAFRDTTDFATIKDGSFLGKKTQARLYRLVAPAGPDLSHWSLPHKRTDDTYHFWS